MKSYNYLEAKIESTEEEIKELDKEYMKNVKAKRKYLEELKKCKPVFADDLLKNMLNGKYFSIKVKKNVDWSMAGRGKGLTVYCYDLKPEYYFSDNLIQVIDFHIRSAYNTKNVDELSNLIDYQKHFK